MLPKTLVMATQQTSGKADSPGRGGPGDMSGGLWGAWRCRAHPSAPTGFGTA